MTLAPRRLRRRARGGVLVASVASRNTSRLRASASYSIRLSSNRASVNSISRTRDDAILAIYEHIDPCVAALNLSLPGAGPRLDSANAKLSLNLWHMGKTEPLKGESPPRRVGWCRCKGLPRIEGASLKEGEGEQREGVSEDVTYPLLSRRILRYLAHKAAQLEARNGTRKGCARWKFIHLAQFGTRKTTCMTRKSPDDGKTILRILEQRVKQKVKFVSQRELPQRNTAPRQPARRIDPCVRD